MTDEQVLEAHENMLRWATELLIAAQPMVDNSYSNSLWNWTPVGLAERFTCDRNGVSNWQVKEEISQFLEVMGYDKD